MIASNWIIDKAKVGVKDVVVLLRNCALETDRWGFKKIGSIRKNIVEIQAALEEKKIDHSFRENIGEIRSQERRLELLNNKDEVLLAAMI